MKRTILTLAACIILVGCSYEGPRFSDLRPLPQRSGGMLQVGDCFVLSVDEAWERPTVGIVREIGKRNYRINYLVSMWRGHGQYGTLPDLSSDMRTVNSYQRIECP